MECTWNLWGLCLVKAGSNTETIFGFSEFLSGLALLIIVYTITDFRYKFRISVSRLNFNKFVYFLIAGIGVGTLITEVWVAQSWPTVRWNLSQAAWQGLLAVILLSVIVMWLWYAFINPPKFGESNYKKYSSKLYQAILKGNEDELKILSDELVLSIPNIVRFANNHEANTENLPNDHIALYANDMALLLANKKLCEFIVAKAPHTALVLFDELAKQQQIHVNSFCTLASNLSAEFIRNKNSLIYHEDSAYDSGLLGHIKPLSSSMYGNYKLLESLGHKSVFDIDYRERDGWDAEQVEMYGKSIITCFKSYLAQNYWGIHSYILHRALSDMESFKFEITGLNNSSFNWKDPSYQKFRMLIEFVSNLSKALEEHDNTPNCLSLRVRERGHTDLYDKIADLYCECIHAAAYISSPIESCWDIQYCLVWSSLFKQHREKTEARKILMHKVRRKIYESIKEMDKWPNYKATRFLSICLNTMWTGKSPEQTSDEDHEALRKVVVQWFKNNYLALVEDNPKLAESCLTGSVSFDHKNKSLTKSFRGGMGKGDIVHHFPLNKP